MASLKTIVASRNIISKETAIEDNLETGQVFMLIPHSTCHLDHASVNQTWSSPNTTGTVVVEAWGAGGSAPNGACCGSSLPGNSPAYTKKTFTLNSQTLQITTTLGLSCNNSANCYKGESGPTCICYVLGSNNGTMCAGGGRGGVWWCIDGSTSFTCCAATANYCHTLFADLTYPYKLQNVGGSTAPTGEGCGIVCNVRCATDIPTASGGDINCPGTISCTLQTCCNSMHCMCQYYFFQPTSAGRFGENGVMLQYSANMYGPNHGCGASMHLDLLRQLSIASRAPSGMPVGTCYGPVICNCHDGVNRWQQFLPHGIGAPPVAVRDSGTTYSPRGGPGTVRITYRGTS